MNGAEGSSIDALFVSTIELCCSTLDGSALSVATTTVEEEESSGAGAADEKGRTTGEDETQPSGENDGNEEEDVSKSRIFFAKLLRPPIADAILDLENIRLEEALVLWRRWRIESIAASIRQVSRTEASPEFFRPSGIHRSSLDILPVVMAFLNI